MRKFRKSFGKRHSGRRAVRRHGKPVYVKVSRGGIRL